jgi:hypothetical protein
MRTLDSALHEALHCQRNSRKFKYPHAFKYMEARWADELIMDGKLRIGTLLDYRSREKFNGGRLDEGEGTSSRFTSLDAHSNEDIPEFARFAVHIPPDAKNVHVIGLGVEQPYGMQDAYVFCVSKRYAPKELLPDFAPADACVEIVNPPEFIATLQETMKEHGRLIGPDDCQYVGRRSEYPAPLVPPFVAKDPRYAHQAEVRVGWVPHEPLELTFIDIVNPRLRNFCRRIL